MDPRSVTFLVQACLGEQLSGSPETQIRRVCTDSRLVRAGDLYVALAGERFDGHSFLPEVIRKGAVAAVVERDKTPPDPGTCAIVAVDNTRVALGRLAARYRRDFSPELIAVCGSNGKTTIKELIASVLRQRLHTLWSEASFNNDIGVPLTLMKLLRNHEAAVLEAGTNHPGELAPLLEMMAPKYGVITNIGREHLEFFKDLEGVAREEGVLAEVLPATGKLFLNGDDPWCSALAARSRAPVMRVGLNAGNEWRASELCLGPDGTHFRVAGPAGFTGDFRIRLLGRHQVANALFAVAIGHELGLKVPEIKHGLIECGPAKMRLESWEQNGVRVLDDSYNANADSVIAALQTLADLPCRGRRIAVLGDMAELGQTSPALHTESGRRAAELGIAQLFAVGKMAGMLASGARAAGLTRVFEFAEVESAAGALKSFVKPGDLVLIKASRSTHLERVAEVLKGG